MMDYKKQNILSNRNYTFDIDNLKDEQAELGKKIDFAANTPK